MLVLTRKNQETIMIGDDIKVTISEIRGDSVKIAIDAPKKIKIYRAEIYQAIASENQASALKVKPEEMDFLRTMGKKEKQTLE